MASRIFQKRNIPLLTNYTIISRLAQTISYSVVKEVFKLKERQCVKGLKTHL